MSKRKRCTICGKLFSPQGLPKHTVACVARRKVAGLAAEVAEQKAAREQLKEEKRTVEEMQAAADSYRIGSKQEVPLRVAERAWLVSMQHELIKSGRIILVSFWGDDE